jgi:hypothetical protein
MLNQSDRQSEDQSSSTAKPSQQLWTLAACPAVDHDARPEGEASSSGRPPLSPRCIVIMAAAGGVAVTASSWPACFFISGLFVRASLAGRGPANFLANRAWRLGVPFLISIFLVTPIAYYPSFLRYHLPGTTDFNFFHFWRHTLTIGPWPSGSAWFLWVLLALGALPQGSSLASAEHGEYRIRRGHKHARVWRIGV